MKRNTGLKWVKSTCEEVHFNKVYSKVYLFQRPFKEFAEIYSRTLPEHYTFL